MPSTTRASPGESPSRPRSRSTTPQKTPNFRCAEYEDFRVMLDKEKAIDAVLCATPDHLHAYVSTTAMRRGKHVYCEKPLTHNIWEARRVAKVAEETGVATQMGNQGHAGEGIRQTVRVDLGRRHRPGARGPRLGRRQPLEQARSRAAHRDPAGAGRSRTGTCGSARASRGPITRATRRSRGATSGRSAPARWAISAATTSTPPFWALDLRDPLSVEGLAGRPHRRRDAPYGEICYYQLRPARRHAAGRAHLVRRRAAAAVPEGLPAGRTLPGRGCCSSATRASCSAKGLAAIRGCCPRKRRRLTRNRRQDPAALEGPSSRLARRLQGRPAGQQQLRVRRQADRNGPAGRRGPANRREARLGRAAMKVTNAPEADPIIKESYRKGWEIPD